MHLAWNYLAVLWFVPLPFWVSLSFYHHTRSIVLINKIIFFKFSNIFYTFSNLNYFQVFVNKVFFWGALRPWIAWGLSCTIIGFDHIIVTILCSMGMRHLRKFYSPKHLSKSGSKPIAFGLEFLGIMKIWLAKILIFVHGKGNARCSLQRFQGCSVTVNVWFGNSGDAIPSSDVTQIDDYSL